MHAFLVAAEKALSSAARAWVHAANHRSTSGGLERIGVTLFERVGGRLELTVNGLELLEHVRAMGAAANRTSLVATGQSESVEGTVCITASESIAAFLLPPILERLRLEHPGILLELVVSNEARETRREADIAIRFLPQAAGPDSA